MTDSKFKLPVGINIGVDYYPEHWDESLWVKDADMMHKAGVKIVRMAEFAWSRLEPDEGDFDFEWLDRAVKLFEDRDIYVVLCTPTNTPPQWLFKKYPEIIQIDKKGNRISIGIRGHRCLNSPVYRELSKKIIMHMVERYKDNKYVIGYQIDNELEANHCCCDVCKSSFREWIKKKYGTIQAVNKAYGNNVWSGEYSDFSQIMPPMNENGKWLNPSLNLDFNRYASESTCDYVKFQSDIIRKISPDKFITTNNWLCENMPDFYDMFENLDVVSYDNYPLTNLPKDDETLYSHAFHLDLMRGIKNKNFWIMEQLSGSVGSWMPMSLTTRPGMLKGYSLQAIAHGADAVVHFRWRTAVSGAEMYWHGIIDHSNVPGRRYKEFCGLCDEVKKIQSLAGTICRNEIAILYSSDNEYAFKNQHQAEKMYYLEQLKQWHDAFTCLGLGVDIINQTQRLDKYKIVIAPTMLVESAGTLKELERAANNGVAVILTNRSGERDYNNKCIMEQLPTIYSELTGIKVTEYEALPDGMEVRLRLSDEFAEKSKYALKSEREENATSQYNLESQNKEVEKSDYALNSDNDVNSNEEIRKVKIIGKRWCDIIEENENVEVLARYDEQFYKDFAAVTRNKYGDGEVYYFGTVLNRDASIGFAREIAKRQQLDIIDGLQKGVEVTYRYGDKKWRFIFNNTEKEQKVIIGKEQITLKPFEMNIQETILH